MLPLEEHVFPVRLHQAAAVQIIRQGSVGGASGALLRNVIQRGEIAAPGGAGVVPQAEHVHPRDLLPPGQLRHQRLVLPGPQQRLPVPHRHHDIRQARGHDLGRQVPGPVRTGQSEGPVQGFPLHPGQLPQPPGRGHVHPHHVAVHGDLQLPGLGAGNVASVGQPPQPPQQGKGGNGGVAAQLHLSCRGEIAQVHAAVLPQADEGRLRMLQLGGDQAHGLVADVPLRQGYPCLVASKQLGGECIHDIYFHGKNLPKLSFYLLY